MKVLITELCMLEGNKIGKKKTLFYLKDVVIKNDNRELFVDYLNKDVISSSEDFPPDEDYWNPQIVAIELQF